MNPSRLSTQVPKQNVAQLCGAVQATHLDSEFTAESFAVAAHIKQVLGDGLALENRFDTAVGRGRIHSSRAAAAGCYMAATTAAITTAAGNCW